MGAVARASSTRAYAVSLCPCFFLATSTSLSIESFCACTQTYEFHGIGRRGLVNSIVADAAGVLKGSTCPLPPTDTLACGTLA
eukprot:scaffold123939_cov22-Tisochrysis_lutea.AAC.1